MNDYKTQILAGMAESTRETVNKYPELRGLARGLAEKLLREGKTKEQVATDDRVIEWTRALPGELAEDGYAPYALCHMIEQLMTPQEELDNQLLDATRRIKE